MTRKKEKKKCSRGSSADKHGTFEGTKLLLRQQIDHLIVGVDHKSDVIVVVIDPYLLPFAVVQFPPAVHLQLPYRASVQREVERQPVLRSQSDHERRIIAPDRWLVQKDGFLSGCPETERYIAFPPAWHLDVRLRGRESDDVFLRVWKYNQREETGSWTEPVVTRVVTDSFRRIPTAPR